MHKFGLAILLVAALLLDGSLSAAGKRKKKDEELPNQVLQLLKEPPGAVVAPTDRLVFQVAPLSPRGLLSQQVRDGLKALVRVNGSASIVRLRAFVAGTGDMRRVQTIVSETFAEHRQPMPALSLVQVGGLPLEGVQVALESVAVGRKATNPNGLAFIAGQPAESLTPTFQMAPLAEQSLANLGKALAGSGLGREDVLRATCFLSSLEDAGAVRQKVAAQFPKAALTFVQLQREPRRSLVECEAVARLRAAPSEPVRFLNPEGLPRSPNYSQVALVAAPRLALSGTQMAFGYQDADARLAFQRLEKVLQQVHSSLARTVMANFYPLTGPIAEMVRRVRFEFYSQANPPAATQPLFEGLPSLDASFAVDVIATVPESAPAGQ